MMTPAMASRFQPAKIVSDTGTVFPPRDSERKESGVAAVSGPDPE